MTLTPVRLAIAVALVLLIGLVSKFPARTAYHWFAPDTVQLRTIEGSIWNGRAAAASIGGLGLANLTWSARPLRLLTGRLSYRLHAEPDGGFVDGDVAVGFGGSLQLDEARFALDLASLAGLVAVPGLEGQANGRIENLAADAGTLVSADGYVEVARLATPLIDRNPIGGYRAEFQTVDDAIVASIEDTDGVFDIAASLRLDRDRRYRFDGRLGTKADTPPHLAGQLQAFLGSPDARGQFPLAFDGTY